MYAPGGVGHGADDVGGGGVDEACEVEQRLEGTFPQHVFQSGGGEVVVAVGAD